MEHVTNPHSPGSVKHAEHEAVFELVRHDDATHVAVRDGSWFDPDTWAGGIVPGDDARVVIAEGVEVNYDSVSDARLFTVRVDGSLNVATDTDTRMIVDTMVVDMRGTLTIGTADNPVQGDVRADIVIANNGAIDVDWDPQLLSRGIVSHGTVEIHGQKKTSDLKVSDDPMAGDSTLTLAEAPLNWQVGDTIVIAGTKYDGYKWDNDIRAVRHHEPEDEVRTITAIEGNIIHLDQALEHDHDTPRADLKTSVANYSRNVTIGTEDPDTAAVHERGHVMFMHSGDVDVRYAAFHELGRTDKSRDAMPASSVEDVASDTNVQGRYAFHFHRSGIDDVENPAMAVGNAVFGSPGWGFVHHDSNAVLHDNATYNTFGAGFVAETGNETGSWSDNIAIYAKGVSWAAPKNGNDASDSDFDLGRTGDGFWFQGRMVESVGNIAASVNTGFVYFHRGKGMLEFDADLFEYPEALGLDDSVNPDDAPILSFENNEAFAAKEGLHVVKANPNQGHDIHSHLKDFTAWSVKSGAHIEYTSHYILENFDVVGKDPTSFSKPTSGISIGNNATDVTIVNAKVAGFEEGITASKSFTFDFDLADVGFTVIDAEINDTTTPYEGFASDEIIASNALVPGRFEIIIDAPLVYRESSDWRQRKVEITGSKTDSLGTVSIPAGSDSNSAWKDEVVTILETEGYYEAADGTRHFVVVDYYSDRVTGEIHKFGHIVEIDANVSLGEGSYKDAVFGGTIDLDDATLFPEWPFPEPPSEPPALSIADGPSLNEGDADTMAFTFDVTRTGDLSDASGVEWNVAGIGADPADADDFGGTLPSGTLKFAAGESSTTFTVEVSGDDSFEPDENFEVVLSAASNATIADGRSRATILNDDAEPPTEPEPEPPTDTGGDLPAGYTVELVDTGTDEVLRTLTDGASIDAELVEGRKLGLVVGTDDGRVESMRLQLGETKQMENVAPYALFGDSGGDYRNGIAFLSGDYLFEVEAFEGDNAGGSLLADFDVNFSVAAKETPEPPSEPPALSIADGPSLNEGDADTMAFTFDVTRTGDLSDASGVEWNVAGIGADPADADDFGGTLPSGTLKFAAGESSTTFTVEVSGDDSFEPDENFEVVLSAASNATIADGRSRATILNDDAEPPTEPEPEPPTDTGGDLPAGYTVELVDTGTDEVLRTLTDGASIDAELVEGRKLGLVVGTDDGRVESMRLQLGETKQMENVAPYALFGDSGGDYRNGIAFLSGDYLFEVEAFEGDNAGGSLLADFDVNFSVEATGTYDEMAVSDGEPSTVMETGTISLDHNLQTVSLDTTFENPVAFATVASRNGADPVAVRVDAVSGNSLSLRLQEPSDLDGSHILETVNYMVVEAGEWELADGTRIAAGIEQVTQTGETGFTEIPPETVTASSIFLTHLQEVAESDFMVARAREDRTGVSVTVQKEAGNDTSLAAASGVGWLSLTPGSGTIDGMQFEAGSFDGDQGISHNTEDLVFEASFRDAPHVIATMSSFNGSDTAWLRLQEQSEDHFKATIEKDRTADSETWHVLEAVDYFAFSQTGVEIEGWAI